MSIRQEDHAGLQIIAVPRSRNRKVRSNETARGGELPLAALHTPACSSRNCSRFEAGHEMPLAGGGKPQEVGRAVAECDLSLLLKLVGAGEAQLRLEECELAPRGSEI